MDRPGPRPLRRFVDLSQDADPELQPAVTEARRRLRALAGER
jgi:hypothetical protein